MSFNGSYCQNVEAGGNESEALSCTGGHVGDGKSIATTKTYVDDDVTKDELTVIESRCEDLITSNVVRHLENVDFTEACDDELLDKTEVEKEENNDVENENSFLAEKPFNGVFTYIAKKIQKECNDLPEKIIGLGGEIVYSLDDSKCTHFIFTGKEKDMNREFRAAKKKQVKIVSPHWVNQSYEQHKLLDELQYPHNFDPNKSIEMSGLSQLSSVSSRFSQKSRISKRSSRSTAPVKKNLLTKESSSSMLKTETALEIIKKGKLPENESQEARENIRKALQNAQSVGQKLKEERQNLKRPSSSFVSPPNSSKKKREETPDTNKIANNNQNSSSKKSTTAPSQRMQVLYDDPIARQEREKLIKENRISLSGSLMEDSDSMANLVNMSTQMEVSMTEAEENLEKDDQYLSQILRRGQKPRFIVSSVGNTLKAEFAKIIEKLGGSYLNKDCFDETCTHLIVNRPSRNEKYLASLASGKFVLSSSYITACKKANRLVNEDEYEFGNPLFCEQIQPRDEMEKRIFEAPYRWRNRLFQLNKGKRDDEKVLAFSGWKVDVLASPRIAVSLIRIVESGGGKICSVMNDDDITHYAVTQDKLEMVDDQKVKSLVVKGAHVCFTDYIAEFLLVDPTPPPQNRYIPSAKNYYEEVLRSNSNNKNELRRTTRRRTAKKY